ncbi:phage protein NinX family protein [Piscinibacter gummiphilus]|uniref:Phage protein NinX family protein n=1 Tax=Piscinibacter gummiphilus TaxID=946333 RepID=A0ABZ0CNB0_9BURK|nr:phage protein NinX family protein [Piscinibacter gummiphilus]WOB06481.1 phage protein NinX family protein [Piscinibacter gummiphilus]
MTTLLTRCKVADLTGAMLDAAVAKALGHEWKWARMCEPDIVEITDWNRPATLVNGWRFQPSTDWAHAGPIIERERIGLREPRHPHPFDWGATSEALSIKTAGIGSPQYGRTPLIAAMRAFVASKLGEEVEL